jgi:hypothetical protein
MRRGAPDAPDPTMPVIVCVRRGSVSSCSRAMVPQVTERFRTKVLIR